MRTDLWSRRALLGGLAAIATLPTPAGAGGRRGAVRTFAALERAADARLRLAVLEPETGRCWGHRLDERFGMCSTFKLLLAGLLLAEVDAGRRSLDEPVPLPLPLPPHAPVTGPRAAEGALPLRDLIDAAQRLSDNGATNAMLALIGGPAGFTAALRARGDSTTRLDRDEPQMNLVVGADPRDTTTPRAMAASAAAFALGDALSAASRAHLVDLMERTPTGAARLRAGLPPGWRAGDKTGTGVAEGMPLRVNDVAVVWPPGRPPVVIAASVELPQNPDGPLPADEAVLAAAARIVAAGLGAPA
ncbi:MAG: class A beta-lactamase [Deltaproteobacteria bacterium]|nr:class A beta-lactamase [Deltaproteobacteria bacterium]